MKKKLFAVIIVLSMVMGLAACGGGGEGSSQSSEKGGGGDLKEKTVIIAMSSGFDTLDPGYAYETVPSAILNAVYNNLFHFTSNDGGPEPALVDQYEWSEDGLTLSLTLKDGVSFASGNPLTAEDVVFSLNRTKNLKANPSFILETMESAEAKDEKTVEIKLSQPDSAFLSKLTFSACSILDSKLVKEKGGTDAEDAATKDTAQTFLNEQSAGSGMYLMTKYTPDSEIVLEKNPNYWGESSNIEKIIVKIQPDANTQLMTLSNGDIDIASNLTDDTIAQLADKEDITIINEATKTISFVMMNMDEEYGGPIANPKVQSAIRKVIDYEGMRTLAGEGAITPASIIQVGFAESKGELAADYRNIEEAKALMAEAGYPDGFSTDLVVSDLDMSGVFMSDLAQKLKDDLAQIGIEANIVATPWAAGYGDDYRDGKLPLTVMYWAIDFNDANVQLEFLPGALVGLRGGWQAEDNPDLATLYQKAAAAIDQVEREEIMTQIQEVMAEEGPFIVLTQLPAHVGYNNRLEGVYSSDPYVIDFNSLRLK